MTTTARRLVLDELPVEWAKDRNLIQRLDRWVKLSDAIRSGRVKVTQYHQRYGAVLPKDWREMGLVRQAMRASGARFVKTLEDRAYDELVRLTRRSGWGFFKNA